MATATQELTVEEKLKSLFRLQTIDSELDQIVRLKGELPMEVSDLEDEITGLETRTHKIDDEMTHLEEEVAKKKNAIKEAEALIKKYVKQQSNVKNNREYDALTKEIELQKLEIQLSEKKINDISDQVKVQKDFMKDAKDHIKGKKKDLENKKVELEKIITETDKDEDKHLKQSEKVQKEIKSFDERLLTAYKRIRKNYKNGLAVVKIERNSCGGCFNLIPPQRQAEISQRKKIIICEHCGRILVDTDIDKK
jgi:predicted  nucleic acid-binding Zn-ribbon protein